jgi:hypothetical protein
LFERAAMWYAPGAKVDEGDAAMSITPIVASKPPMTVSPEVYEYAGKHGIGAPLERMLEATPRVFPTATSIRVFMEPDAEEAGLWFIVFEVRIPATDVPDYLAARRLWGEEWARAYPYPRLHHFVLSLEPTTA